jgi:hypothetical protein
MTAEYDRRQTADRWPTRERWNPRELPGWYRELLGELAGSLTAWRAEHDPPRWTDARCDPRCPSHRAVRSTVR